MDFKQFMPEILDALELFKDLKEAVKENTEQLKLLNQKNEEYEEDEEKKRNLQDRIINLLDNVGIDTDNIETATEEDIIQQMQKKLNHNN